MKTKIDIIVLILFVLLLVNQFYQGSKKLDEERKRTLIMRDIQTKVNKLWENLK